MKDLIDLAKKYDYNTFLKKTDGLTLKYNILYRGMSLGDDLSDNCFMTDWVGHALEYGEWVDGIIHNDKILTIDNNKFGELREFFVKILLGSEPRDFDYDDIWEPKLKKALELIYQPYFSIGKLSDVMYQSDCDEDCVIDWVYQKIVDSTEKYDDISMTKKNDFLIPLFTYWAKTKNINIISFWGGDYGGAYEFVVSDISKYQKLSDIWKSVN